MSEEDLATKEDLIEKFKQVSAQLLNSKVSMGISNSFRKFYHVVSNTNTYAYSENESWFLGPIYLGSTHDDWISVLSRVVNRIHVESTDMLGCVTVKLINQVRPFSSLFETELRNLIQQATYKCDILTKTNFAHKPYHGIEGTNPDVFVNSTSLHCLLQAEDRWPGYRYPFLSAFMTHETVGLRNSHETGSNKKARWQTRNKFKGNLGSYPVDKQVDLIGAIHTLSHIFDMRSLDITLDDSLANMLRILDKDTSSGFVYDDVFKVTPGGIIKQASGTKKQLSTIAANQIHSSVQRANNFFLNGEGSLPYYPPIAVENDKWDILNQRVLTRLMEDDVIPISELEKAQDKTRLFYIAGSLALLMDKMIAEWFSNICRYYLSAIGIKVEGGGILQLFDMMNGGDSCPLRDEWEQAADTAWELYGVDLRDIQTGEGDFSKFDFSVMYEGQVHIGAFIASCIKKPDHWEQETFDWFMKLFISRTGVKLIYVPELGAWYYVRGSQNSGEYLTSVGNTFYLMITFIDYCDKLAGKFPDNPVVRLVLNVGMIMFFFYGDDQVGKWPRYMNDFTLYPASDTCYQDYVNFCIEHYGLQFKWPSMKIFDYVYGVRMFETLETGEVVETAHRPSVSFLRYTVAHVYLDGNYCGLRMYRDTEDLIQKLGLSKSATKNPKTHLCQLASLARLSHGNLEAYSQLKNFYTLLSAEIGPPSTTDWDAYYDNMSELPFSIRMVIQDAKVYGFPQQDEIHAKQMAGFENRTGFSALDELGNPIDGTGYYTRARDPREPITPYKGVYSDMDGEDEILEVYSDVFSRDRAGFDY